MTCGVLFCLGSKFSGLRLFYLYIIYDYTHFYGTNTEYKIDIFFNGGLCATIFLYNNSALGICSRTRYSKIYTQLISSSFSFRFDTLEARNFMQTNRLVAFFRSFAAVGSA